VPQGSTKAFIPRGWKRAIITSTSRNLKEWRQQIVSAITTERDRRKISITRGPVTVSLTFFLTKPKSSPKKKVIFPIKRPDLDKLIRAAFDALTGTLIIDDSQIIQVLAAKAWEEKGPGVQIDLEEL
jgi:crossover junction endodeoxyribonuclease RusA